jgi:hypothetical protein
LGKRVQLFSYTLVPGNATYDGTNAGQASVEYSDLNSGVTIVDFVAYLNVSGPQLPAISGRNNGGGMCPISMLAGDPINVGTGNLFETQTDFTAAPETQLSFAALLQQLRYLERGSWGRLAQHLSPGAKRHQPGKNVAVPDKLQCRLQLNSHSDR